MNLVGLRRGLTPNVRAEARFLRLRSFAGSAFRFGATGVARAFSVMEKVVSLRVLASNN